MLTYSGMAVVVLQATASSDEPRQTLERGEKER